MVLSLFKEFHFPKSFFPDALFYSKILWNCSEKYCFEIFYGSYSDETSVSDGTICLHLSIWPCHFGKLKKKNTAAKLVVCKDIEFRRIINAFLCKKAAYNQI